MICDGGGCKGKVRSSGGRSFQRRGAVMDMTLLENVRWKVAGGRESSETGGWSGRAGWMIGEELANVLQEFVG